MVKKNGARERDRAAALAAFGQRLQQRRQAQALSQQELAERCGLAVNNVQNWEQGRAEPRLLALVALARGLGVSLDVLTGLRTGPRGPGRPRTQ